MQEDRYFLGTTELIRERLARLTTGESFDNPKLTKIAAAITGSGLARPRDSGRFQIAKQNQLRSETGDSRAYGISPQMKQRRGPGLYKETNYKTKVVSVEDDVDSFDFQHLF